MPLILFLYRLTVWKTLGQLNNIGSKRGNLIGAGLLFILLFSVCLAFTYMQPPRKLEGWLGLVNGNQQQPRRHQSRDIRLDYHPDSELGIIATVFIRAISPSWLQLLRTPWNHQDLLTCCRAVLVLGVWGRSGWLG